MTRRATPQPDVDRMVSTSWSGRRWSSPAARQGRALARGLEGRLPLQHHYVRDQNSSSCRAYFSLALKHGIYREPRPFAALRDRPRLAPRCLARTRSGTPCQKPAAKGKKRCRLHGGVTGSTRGRPSPSARRCGLSFGPSGRMPAQRWANSTQAPVPNPREEVPEAHEGVRNARMRADEPHRLKPRRRRSSPRRRGC